MSLFQRVSDYGGSAGQRGRPRVPPRQRSGALLLLSLSLSLLLVGGITRRCFLPRFSVESRAVRRAGGAACDRAIASIWSRRLDKQRGTLTSRRRPLHKRGGGFRPALLRRGPTLIQMASLIIRSRVEQCELQTSSIWDKLIRCPPCQRERARLGFVTTLRVRIVFWFWRFYLGSGRTVAPPNRSDQLHQHREPAAATRPSVEQLNITGKKGHASGTRVWA